MAPEETTSTTGLSELEADSPVLASDQAEGEAVARKGLESRALNATVWTVVDYGASMLLRVANSFVLTHILMPSSFGLMTLVTTLVVGISLLSDIGLSPAVIQNPRGDDPLFLNTVWTLQVLRGFGIFVVALALAWPMSLFYHEPKLVLLIAVLSFTVVLSGLCSTNLMTLSRHMGVRRLLVYDVSSQFISLIATVGWALLVGRSVWALVAGSYATGIFRLALSFYSPLVPGIHNKLAWDRDSARSIVHFGKWILLATACFFFASQGDRLILGKLITFSMLGVYGIAYTISDIPRQIINAFCNKVGYPFIAKMVHLPRPEFRTMFLSYRLKALLAGAVLLTMMVFLGGSLVRFVYDSRYHEAAWMVPILALGLWHTLMYSTTMPALYSVGKSNYAAIGNAAYCAVVVSGIWVGFHFFGMFGAVVAVAAGDFPLYIVFAIGASREGVSTWKQDLLTTGAFLALLSVGEGLRMMMMGSLRIGV